jgi:hypothetical protein
LNRREERLRERAERLTALDNALAILEGKHSAARKDEARRDIERRQDQASPHASCVQAACDLYGADRDKARELFRAARDCLDGLS